MRLRIISLLLLIIAVACCIYLNEYPTGDWMTAPLFSIMVIIPIVCIEILLFLLLLYNPKKYSTPAIITQVCLSVFCIVFLIDYILKHPN